MKLAKFYTWLQRRVDAVWALPIYAYYRFAFRKPRYGGVANAARWPTRWMRCKPQVFKFVKLAPHQLWALGLDAGDYIHQPDGFMLVPVCALGGKNPPPLDWQIELQPYAKGNTAGLRGEWAA